MYISRLVRLCIGLCCIGCMSEGEMPARLITFREPSAFGKAVYDFSRNPISSRGFQLGKTLFFDPILSVDSTISCASCHIQASAFAHTNHRLSHGINDGLTKRNAPALQNLAWKKDFSWIGGVKDLDQFAFLPIQHPQEMGEKMYRVIRKLKRSQSYPELFRQAFADTISVANTLKALAQFQLMMISDQSKYDQFLAQKLDLTAEEKQGFALFKTHCASCHAGARFTNDQFMKNGIESLDPNDLGRYEVTGVEKDKHAFIVPSLRNIARTKPYMHDGQFRNLAGVIEFYATQSSLNIDLSPAEQKALLAFLHTLTDNTFLTDEIFTN